MWVTMNKTHDFFKSGSTNRIRIRCRWRGFVNITQNMFSVVTFRLLLCLYFRHKVTSVCFQVGMEIKLIFYTSSDEIFSSNFELKIVSGVSRPGGHYQDYRDDLAVILLSLLCHCTSSEGRPSNEFQWSTWTVSTSLAVPVTPWAPSQYKDRLSQVWVSNVKDKAVARPSYLQHGDTYNGKTTSLYWDDPWPFLITWINVKPGMEK